jgi:hypothetical protein
MFRNARTTQLTVVNVAPLDRRPPAHALRVTAQAYGLFDRRLPVSIPRCSSRIAARHHLRAFRQAKADCMSTVRFIQRSWTRSHWNEVVGLSKGHRCERHRKENQMMRMLKPRGVWNRLPPRRVRSGLMWLFGSASRKFFAAITRRITFRLLSSAFAVEASSSLAPAARERLVKVAAISADIVRQCVYHSRRARLGSSSMLSDSFLCPPDQFFNVCNFLLKISRRYHIQITR